MTPPSAGSPRSKERPFFKSEGSTPGRGVGDAISEGRKTSSPQSSPELTTQPRLAGPGRTAAPASRSDMQGSPRHSRPEAVLWVCTFQTPL